MISKKILGLGGAMALTATMALAGGHATPEAQAVKARQAAMQLYAFNLGILGGMAKGDTEYNADAAQAAADNLAALTTMNQMAMWPQGTDSDAMEGSRALPALWQNFPDVSEKGKALAMAAAAMAENAGSLDGIRANIGAVGGACGACHKAYRAPDS